MQRLVALLATLIWGVPALSGNQNPFQRPECNGVIHGTVFDLSGERIKNLKVVAWPLGIDLAVTVPEAETDQTGEYLFQNVCSGRYTIVIAGKYSYPYLNEFLYGSAASEVRLTAASPQAELPVYVHPKPAIARIHVTNQKTKAEVLRFSVKLRIPEQQISPEISFEFDSTIHDHQVPLPPDKDVLLHVYAKGFHEWHESAGRGKLMRLASGSQAALEVELAPR